MGLFQKHLAKLTRRAEAEGMDHEQDDPPVENDKDGMPVVTEASLRKQAADDDSSSDSDDDDKKEWSDDDDSDKKSDDDKKDDDDKTVARVAVSIERELDRLVAEVKSTLKRNKASAKVAAATIEGLRRSGFLINQPFQVDWKKTKLAANEVQFVKQVVAAARESAEDILEAGAETLRASKKTVRHAKALDKRLALDGYVRSSFAAPKIENKGTVRKAQQAMSKTRRK